jgi:hypothetical protein
MGRLWGRAAAVVALFAVLLLLARQIRPAVAALAYQQRAGYTPWGLSEVSWARIVVWTLITVALLRGWRRPMIGLAWFAVAGELAVAVVRDEPEFVSAALAFWPAVLAALVATLVSLRRAPRAAKLLGPWRCVALGAAALVSMAPPVASVWLGTIYPEPAPGDPGTYVAFEIDGLVASILAICIYTLVGVIVLFVVAGFAPLLRRRILALLAPVSALLLLGQVQPDSPFADFSLNPILPPLAQHIVLVGLPLVTVAAGLVTVYFLDRTPEADDTTLF